MADGLRIAICTAQVPFVHGGNEVLVEGLRAALTERGHKVAVVALPFKWYPRPQLVSSVLAWRMIDISEADGQPVDLAVCTKFPSYAVRHPNKVTWLVHQFRQAYDWYGTPMSDFTASAEDVRVRRLIQGMDRKTLGESRRIYTISRNVAARLRRFNGLEGTPLYPPVRAELDLTPGPYGSYIFSLNRLDTTKRLDLLLRALPHAPGVRVVIAGTGPESENLKRLASRLAVTDRVDFAGFVSDAEAAHLYTNAGAVYFAPLDEDYGYGAVEALTAARPVITTNDAGGVLEFVEDGVTGLVTMPEPQAVGRAVARISTNTEEAERMGRAGRQRVKNITWDRVVAALVT